MMPPTDKGTDSMTFSISVVFPTPGRPVIAARALIPISSDSILMDMTDKGRTQRTWADIIAEEVNRHPDMTAQDLHKLVVQGCLGGDHLLRDANRFASELSIEWDELPSQGATQGALQRIHPSGRVARLHLAPCKASGISRRDVTQLLLAQPLKAGHREAFEWAWATILHCARTQDIPFSVDQLAPVRASDDAGHHSADYGFASYRILNNIGHGATKDALCRLGILH